MNNTFIQSVIRTPGVLFMAILMTAFVINAGVEYINATGMEGPNLIAAATLLAGQFTVALIHQIRRVVRRPAKQQQIC